MILGSDFDNTLACCDPLFYLAAVQRKLIPPTTGRSKLEVRDALRKAGKEPAWTELQGFVYGEMIREAEAFPGALGVFGACASQGIPIFVISHKTEKPFLGPAYDLRSAAREWLSRRGFGSGVGIRPANVFWEATKEAKLQRIAQQGCTDFIDDLPEFLLEPAFPPNVTRYLFDPEGRHDAPAPLIRVRSWMDLGERLLGKSKNV